MRPVSPHAHTGQAISQSIPAIVADAIRRAALAPSEREALDIAGGALAAVAALSSQASAPAAFRRPLAAEDSYTATEVRHG